MKCNGKILDENGSLTDELCGCAVTAERVNRNYKNGSKQEFNYYRCSNTTRTCSQRNQSYMKEIVGRKISYTQEEVEILFEDIFQSFSFDEFTCNKMQKYLWDEHTDAKKDNKRRVYSIRKRLDELDEYLDKSYEDKLCGQIEEELWSRKSNGWNDEKEKLEAELKIISNNKDDYMKVGVELIELIQHSGIIYKHASPERKRRLVDLISSNLLLADGIVEYTIKKPFNYLIIKDFNSKKKDIKKAPSEEEAYYKIWYSQGDSNPCCRREKAVS